MFFGLVSPRVLSFWYHCFIPVLNFLNTLDFASDLSLKDLSLKLTMLLCLTTAQRGQAICSFDVNYVQEFEDKYKIMVMQKLKSSKPGVHLEQIELQAFKEDKKLCVLSALRSISARQGICEMDNPNC